MKIALIVPFLDEEEALPGLMASIATQERLPDRLLLVDDGSGDGSASAAEAFAAAHAWAEVLRRPRRPPERDRLIGCGALRAFVWAAERCQADVLGKVDADLLLPQDFLASLERRLEADERLGIVGAHLAMADASGRMRRMRCPASHVHGATKLYRRRCWEQITPVPARIGWDTLDEVRARMAGWRTASFSIPSADPVHVRRMGVRDGLLRGYRRAGLAAWTNGSPPVTVALAAVARMRDRPYVLAGLSFGRGWLSGAFRGAPRASAEERAWVRAEQLSRLRRLIVSPVARPAYRPDPATPHVVVLLENQGFPYDPRVRSQVEAIRAAGFDVTVLCPSGGNGAPFEEDLAGVRVLRFAAPPSGRGIRDYIAEFGISAWRMLRLVRRVARERPADAVLVCNPPDFLVELVRPLARRGAGIIFDDRELSPELFEAKFGRRGALYALLVALERRAFREADAVLVTNRAYAVNVTDRAGVPADRVFVVGNGPDRRRIHPVPARQELKGGREHLVLWMGAMSTQDGLGFLIEAADRLVSRNGRTDVTFAIVGPGDVRDQLADQVRRLGLEGAVLLPGRVDDDLVRAYLSTADVCVNTDQPNPMNDRAAMRKVLEYMAMGRAVVQFPLAEMQRLCGDTTLYARPADATDLADRIAELLDDPARRELLGEAARARVDAGLMWEHEVPSLLAALEFARACGAARRR